MVAILQVGKLVAIRMGADCATHTSTCASATLVVVGNGINYFCAFVANNIMGTIIVIRIAHRGANMITFNGTTLRANTIHKGVGFLGHYNAVCLRINQHILTIDLACPLAASTTLMQFIKASSGAGRRIFKCLPRSPRTPFAHMIRVSGQCSGGDKADDHNHDQQHCQ